MSKLVVTNKDPCNKSVLHVTDKKVMVKMNHQLSLFAMCCELSKGEEHLQGGVQLTNSLATTHVCMLHVQHHSMWASTTFM